MKVKKEGINPNTWEMDVICPDCKAELTICCDDFQRERIKIVDHFFFTTISRKYIIKCSECKKDILISSRKVPSIIREKLENAPGKYIITM